MGEEPVGVFTKDELKLIRYWRESCHLYNDFCPLHCAKATEFCKALIEKIAKLLEGAKSE